MLCRLPKVFCKGLFQAIDQTAFSGYPDKGVVMRGKITIGIAALCMLVLCIGCKGTKHTQEAAAVIPQQKAPAVDTTDVFNKYYVKDTAAEAQAAKADKGVVFSSQGTTAMPASGGRYVIQVACEPKLTSAKAIVAKLGASGISAYIVKVADPVESMAGTFYRVRIGFFGSIAEATAYGDSHLTENGFEYWVDRKKNDAVSHGVGGLGGKNNRAYYEY
jgi:cell division protein FtsN